MEAIANLVAGLNEQMGAGTYATVADPSTGVGTDAIKLGLIYKPAVLSLVGTAISDIDPRTSAPLWPKPLRRRRMAKPSMWWSTTSSRRAARVQRAPILTRAMVRLFQCCSRDRSSGSALLRV